MWTGLNWLSIGPIMSSCQHGNDPSGSIKIRKFYYLDDYLHTMKRNKHICRVGIKKDDAFSTCDEIYYNPL